MPRPKAKQSAHAQLDDLRQRVAAEHMRARDLELEIEAAKLEVEDESSAIAEAYAFDNESAVAKARRAEELAVARLRDLHHRQQGAQRRVERAEQQLDSFRRDDAKALLEERVPAAREVAMNLTRAGHEFVRAHHAYTSMRMEIDGLVAATPNAVVRSDGPPGTHAWESEVRGLERVMREVSEVEPPLPRWLGVQQRQQQDQVHRRIGLLRRKKSTPAVQEELERLNQQHGGTPAVTVLRENS
jgi:hypothetical protein